MINVSCAIILDSEDRVLVTQRSGSMPLPFKWEFPGGKVEAGETAGQALLREIKEELNLTVEITGTLTPSTHTDKDKEICLIPFLARITAGEIILREHIRMEWLPAWRLSEPDWAPADLPIVQELMRLLVA